MDGWMDGGTHGCMQVWMDEWMGRWEPVSLQDSSQAIRRAEHKLWQSFTSFLNLKEHLDPS